MTCDYPKERLADVMRYRTDHEQVVNVALQVLRIPYDPNCSLSTLRLHAEKVLLAYLEGK